MAWFLAVGRRLLRLFRPCVALFCWLFAFDLLFSCVSRLFRSWLFVFYHFLSFSVFFVLYVWHLVLSFGRSSLLFCPGGAGFRGLFLVLLQRDAASLEEGRLFCCSVAGFLCGTVRSGMIFSCHYNYFLLFGTLWLDFDFDGCPFYAKTWGCIVRRRVVVCSVPPLACCLSITPCKFWGLFSVVLWVLSGYRRGQHTTSHHFLYLFIFLCCLCSHHSSMTVFTTLWGRGSRVVGNSTYFIIRLEFQRTLSFIFLSSLVTFEFDRMV